MSAVRLEVLPDDRLPQRGPGRWDNGNFHLSEFRAFAAAGGSTKAASPLVFSRASADHDEGPAISAAQAIDGKNETHWGVHPRYGEPHEAVFELKEPRRVSRKARRSRCCSSSKAERRDTGSAASAFPRAVPRPTRPVVAPLSGELAAILRVPADERTPEQRKISRSRCSKAENRARPRRAARAAVGLCGDARFPAGRQLQAVARSRARSTCSTRGELNKPGELIGPGTLGCVPGMPRELAIADAGDEVRAPRRAGPLAHRRTQRR